MFARLTLAHPQAGKLDEAVTLTQEVFAAAAQRQPGYRGFLLFVDREAQQLTGISLWDTEANRDASAGASGYYQDGVTAFRQLLREPPRTSSADVAIWDNRTT